MFFRWYNTVHRHSGIGLMTSHTVRHGYADQLTEERGVTLMTAFAAHPHRFKGLAPKPPAVPTAAWINPPKPIEVSEDFVMDRSVPDLFHRF